LAASGPTGRIEESPCLRTDHSYDLLTVFYDRPHANREEPLPRTSRAADFQRGEPNYDFRRLAALRRVSREAIERRLPGDVWEREARARPFNRRADNSAFLTRS
jgi:hypothetical protein